MDTETLIALRLCVAPHVSPEQSSQLITETLRHEMRNLRRGPSCRTAHANGVKEMHMLQA